MYLSPRCFDYPQLRLPLNDYSVFGFHGSVGFECVARYRALLNY